MPQYPKTNMSSREAGAFGVRGTPKTSKIDVSSPNTGGEDLFSILFYAHCLKYCACFKRYRITMGIRKAKNFKVW